VRDIAPGAVFSELMIELGRYDAVLRTRVARAIALERWSNRYRFCPVCGAVLFWTSDAIAKICTNPQRVHRHFPRLDPAIIVLVTAGDRALLGRSRRFPPGFYSTLAGFVEPGESVEAALRREVFEEAGVHVGETRYFGSESWPFPRSLMLGFFAEAKTVEITLGDAELEDARWFERRELQELQDRMKIARPFFDTIARRLIDTWLAERRAAPCGAASD
jgi:NAD+ diphosphatase